ncbi:MAG: metalloregulator ArsR/SmtB family transcription factor [Acidobacteriota bacterium]
MSRLELVPTTTSAAAAPVPTFAALGDFTRLELIARLGDGSSHSIAQLTDGLDLTRQGVTKHLRVLERAGLVKSERIGRESRYTFLPEPIDEARAYLDRVSRQWDEALGRLRAFVEDS